MSILEPSLSARVEIRLPKPILPRRALRTEWHNPDLRDCTNRKGRQPRRACDFGCNTVMMVDAPQIMTLTLAFFGSTRHFPRIRDTDTTNNVRTPAERKEYADGSRPIAVGSHERKGVLQGTPLASEKIA
jgi:hypothetical protein